SKRRSVVDAVPDHDRWPGGRFRPHGLDLVGRRGIADDSVDGKRPPDRLGDFRSVAGDEHDPGDPLLSESAQSGRSLGAKFVDEDESGRMNAVDADGDADAASYRRRGTG